MSADNLMTALARSTSAVAFRIASSAVIGFVGALVIARIIGAPLYGSYLSAQALTLTVSAIAQWGIGMALVRTREEPDTQRLATAWWLLLIIGIFSSALGIAACFIAFPGETFHEARLAALVMLPVMALTLPATVPLALLERRLQFTHIAGIELLGSIAWLTSGLALGLAGAGIWALPLGWIGQQIIHAIAWHRLAAYRPSRAFAGQDVRALVGFGTTYSTAVVSWQVRPLIAPMTLGNSHGTAAVGQVGMASRIMEALNLVRHALWRASAPVLGRLREDDIATAHVLRAAGAASCAATAALCSCFVLAQPLVRYLIGPDWNDALAVFPYFAVHGMIASLVGLLALALHVHGRSLLVTVFNGFHIAVLALAALYYIPRYGVTGWGCAELLACASFPFLIVACPRGIRQRLAGLPSLALLIPPIAWYLFQPGLISGIISAFSTLIMSAIAWTWLRQAKHHVGQTS